MVPPATCIRCCTCTWRCAAVGVVFLLLATSASAADIRIGFVAPISGPLAAVGHEMLRSAQTSVAKLNTGELVGARFDVELVIRDDQCKPPLARALASRFAGTRTVIAVIGHCPSLGQVVAPVYHTQGLMYVATPMYNDDARPWNFYDGVVFRLGAGELNRDARTAGDSARQRSRDAVRAAFELLFSAIRDTGSTDARALARALRSAPRPTITGWLRSGETGQIRRQDPPSAMSPGSGPYASPRPWPLPPLTPGGGAPRDDAPTGSSDLPSMETPHYPGGGDSSVVIGKGDAHVVIGGGDSNVVIGGGDSNVVISDQPPADAPPPPVAVEDATETAAVVEKLKPAADPQWNSRLTLPGSGDVSSLEASDDLVYEFVLDLSPFDYRQLAFTSVAPARIDPILGNKIENLLKRGIDELRLKLRPVVVGGQIEIIEPIPTGYDLKLDLTKLAPSPLALQQAAVVLNRVRRGQATLDDFADTVHAGEIRFEIAANSPGCAVVALSVWDRRGTIPYDHLVRTVAVKRRGGPTPDCGDNQLRGGLNTLLDTATTHLGGAPAPADVALHIFEFPHAGDKRSVAVMVDRLTLERTAAETDVEDREGVYAWTMRSALTDYLSLPTHLRAKLQAARDRATRGGSSHPYGELAKELAEKIFTPGEAQAQSALRVLQQRVLQTHRRLTLLARIISVDNEPIYLPLGLLAASSATPVLAKPLTVIQPLVRERYVHRSTCIEPWTFTIPRQLKGVRGIDLAGIERPERGWSRWLDTLPSLVNYLTGAGVVSTGKQGEGLLLLAHHDSGVLWFNDSGQRAKIEDFRRTFKPGSAAILAACSTLGVKPENRLIAKELNTMGMDALIVSPFQVLADYGAQFAVDFAATVERNRVGNQQPTIVELFEQATQRTAEVYRDAGKSLDEMALEFMVLGDHNLKLCAPNPSR